MSTIAFIEKSLKIMEAYFEYYPEIEYKKRPNFTKAAKADLGK